MGRFVIRRILQAIPLLVVISLIVFILIHAIPGGPVSFESNPRASLATKLALEKQYGLDKPLPVQYLLWLWAAIHGNFGTSFQDGVSVSQRIIERIPATFELLGGAFILALLVAIPIGIISAVKKYSLTDYIVTVLSYFGISMPVFWFALMVILVFAVQLHVLPTDGISDPTYQGPLIGRIVDNLRHLVLPIIVLSLLFIAQWGRYMRSSTLEVLNQDYMRTARSKGLSEFVTIIRHAVRNALIPVVTVVAIDFGSIAGGAVITETLFSWPGIGRLFYDALESRDYPILLAMLLMSAVAVVLFNLIADVIYALLDPRIRYS